MWTAHDVTSRLREEFGFKRLVVKLLRCRPEDPHYHSRWAVMVRVPTLTGRRTWPVTLMDDGTVHHGGETQIRELGAIEECAYVHEGPAGEYLSLDPNALRQELERRDTHKRNLSRELREAITKKRATIRKDADDEVRQLTKYYRRAFAKIADGEEISL